MIAPLTLLNIFWSVWLVGWMLAARWTAKTVARQSGAARLTHGLLVWAGAMLLFVRPERFGSTPAFSWP